MIDRPAPKVEFTCPLCGGEAAYVFAPTPRIEIKDGSMPGCQIARAPDRFMQCPAMMEAADQVARRRASS